MSGEETYLSFQQIILCKLDAFNFRQYLWNSTILFNTLYMSHKIYNFRIISIHFWYERKAIKDKQQISPYTVY